MESRSESIASRLHSLLSPTQSLPLSSSSPNLAGSSSSSSSTSTKTPNQATPSTTPIQEERELSSFDSEKGIPQRHFSESRTIRKASSRVLPTKELHRSQSVSSRISVDEEDANTADTAKYGACAFGQQLRSIEVELPRRVLPSDAPAPGNEGYQRPLSASSTGSGHRTPRRLVSLARVVDLSPTSPRSMTESEELWGIRVRYYVENFEQRKFMTVEIQDLVPGGPAELNGIERNDQVLAINGYSVKSMTSDEVVRHLSHFEDDLLHVTILPGAQTKISNVQIFSPSRSSLDTLWCVRNQLTTLTLWDIDLGPKAKLKTHVDLTRLILISNLAICHCRLQSLDIIEGLSSLQFLSHARFSNNQLTAAALGNGCPLSRIPSIKTLLLNKNHIKDFPVCLYRLPKLEHLNLAFNQLRELPRTINALENLKQLNLDGNGLVELDTTLLGEGFLKFLTITRNRVDYNPGLEKQGLSAFALYGNPFESQPYHSSPLPRRESRESLRHGTATWRRRHRVQKGNPAVSPLLHLRKGGMTESRITLF